MRKKIIDRVRQIKILVMDVDGVLTDGRIIIGSGNEEFKFFNVLDGEGVVLAKSAGLKIALISGRFSGATERRAQELSIDDVYQGVSKKEESYEELLKKYGLSDAEVAYIGDDLLDLSIMRRVGFAASVPNACKEVKKSAAYVTHLSGGQGAVREIIELILKSQGKWEKILEMRSMGRRD
ncbi:MAG: 3-deoxy-D-manno-octulosonate 8-phosphate phosphatase KdsC [Syntrophomonadaceae bacterium]|nr:3-deoxy-D-manno-octulosonate 8-phosphate phosphatase KdsC [Bacillota bacterium]